MQRNKNKLKFKNFKLKNCFRMQIYIYIKYKIRTIIRIVGILYGFFTLNFEL